MFLIGDNFLLALLFYGSMLWLLGAALVATFVATLVYAATYYDRGEVTGRRACPTLRRWHGWRWWRRCYRHQVVVMGDGDDDERNPCIYAASPHGINALSFLLTFMLLSDARVRRLFSHADPVCAIFPAFFWLPVLRELVLALGAVNVRRETLEFALLHARRDVALIPEGTREIAPPANFQRKRRPGFLRLAWEQRGAVDCAYVYMHNEDRNYIAIGHEWRWRRWLVESSWLGFAFTFYAGAFCCFPLTTFIGPRHRYVKGESLDDYVSRYYKMCDELRAQWTARKED